MCDKYVHSSILSFCVCVLFNFWFFFLIFLCLFVFLFASICLFVFLFVSMCLASYPLKQARAGGWCYIKWEGFIDFSEVFKPFKPFKCFEDKEKKKKSFTKLLKLWSFGLFSMTKISETRLNSRFIKCILDFKTKKNAELLNFVFHHIISIIHCAVEKGFSN